MIISKFGSNLDVGGFVNFKCQSWDVELCFKKGRCASAFLFFNQW
jgi:hypothetical protein